jgi:16S rRNA (cytidine1402-2'-O)-methyltransferase
MERREGKSGADGSKPEGRLAPGLYLTATPIGNLGDITLRALDVLRRVDVIACEDTRVSRRLLDHYGITTRLLVHHEHNAARVRPQILARLAAGEAVALVTDAGTPLVSDPGFKLARQAIKAGHAVTALPGASSVLAGLLVSGLPSDRFFFAGFLPSKLSARRHAIAGLAQVPGSLIILESPRRLAQTLADLAAALGPRPAAVARELTKLHEEVRRGDLQMLACHYAATEPPKGETVIIVGPGAAAEAPPEALDALLKAALAELPLKQAATMVAAKTGISRREAYARALVLRGARTPANPRQS